MDKTLTNYLKLLAKNADHNIQGFKQSFPEMCAESPNKFPFDNTYFVEHGELEKTTLI
jgi:hypothetical protein